MAAPEDRWSDNAPGAFFVDRECIVCSVCSELAPDHFRLAESEDHDVCYQQPVTEAQRERCLAALAECPVEAIGELHLDRLGVRRSIEFEPRAGGLK